MAAIFDSLGRIPNLGFFAGWCALVLLLACALVYIWSRLHRRFGGGATSTHRAANE